MEITPSLAAVKIFYTGFEALILCLEIQWVTLAKTPVMHVARP